MLHKPLGALSAVLNKKWAALILFQALVLVGAAGYRAWDRSSVECVRCHSDSEKMGALGHPELIVTPESVAAQSRHTLAECRDCHLGNGRATDKDAAHQGMLKMILVGEDLRTKDRKTYYPSELRPTGENRIFEWLPKIQRNGKWANLEIRNLLWHDRDPQTFNFDPEIARKTCGKSNCHPGQLDQFLTTNMGANRRQRTMRTWTDPYGPHNCGPSFADLPPTEILASAGFDYRNTRAIQENLNLGFTLPQARDRQRICNTCHAGCLDCHFAPDKGEPHRFVRTPPAESCGGRGRSTSMCHSGASHSRRGEAYIGGDYAIPYGMAPDIHYTKGLTCVACHPTGEQGMGDMERRATCGDCHLAVEAAHAGSIHRKLDCAACHVQELGGYQITVWGPGYVGYEWSPFYKYGLYYGTQKPPILLKDQQGRWMPVKIMPHSVGNIKEDVPASDRIRFRWPEGETRDPYYVVGTVDDLPAGNKHLLWIEMQQAAHPFGRSRSCESCHQDRQTSRSEWNFIEDQGPVEPFGGGYVITADKKELAITDMHADREITPFEDYQLTDFASWIYLKDRWRVPGDFAVPTPPEKYRDALHRFELLERQLSELDAAAERLDPKKIRRYRDARAAALHQFENPERSAGLKRLLAPEPP
jgi:hypothetical protein